MSTTNIGYEERTEIISILEAKGITPTQGVSILIGVIYTILSANGYSKMEMCRYVNDGLMSATEIPESMN
ncbi:MAG TPA: hypothetical protein VFV92_03300 [Candidatus Bathyarchaeia archaeon]|nr:hypothetical protein [Candidatus Bathyarchaeia archaeon]